MVDKMEKVMPIGTIRLSQALDMLRKALNDIDEFQFSDLDLRYIYKRAVLDIYNSIPDKALSYGVVMSAQIDKDITTGMLRINLDTPLENIVTNYIDKAGVDNWMGMSKYLCYCYDNRFTNPAWVAGTNRFGTTVPTYDDKYENFIVPNTVLNSIVYLLTGSKLIHPGAIDEVLYKMTATNGLLTTYNGVWAKHGSYLYIAYADEEAITENGTLIFGVRNPILDNMLPESKELSSLHFNIDLSDTLFPASIRLAYQLCIEQLSKNIGVPNGDVDRKDKAEADGVQN